MGERVDSAALLQQVANRILSAWLASQGRTEIEVAGRLVSLTGHSVDIACTWRGARQRIKVKPDPYYGIDPAKISDRALSFYRLDAHAFAIETVSDAVTRQPGWVFDSQADYLYYYYLVLSQTEEEIAALAGEPDEVFFSEIAVDRDELVILPMRETRAWFEGNQDRYASRPVSTGPTAAWYRLVPRADLQSAVGGINRVGPVFRSITLG